MTAPDTYLKAQRAVKYAFFFMGMPIGILIPRLAEIKQGLGAADAAYGTAIAIGGMGALLGNYLGSRIVHQIGSRQTVRFSIILLLATNVANALAPSVSWFAFIAFSNGLTYAITNIAMNSQGVLVEQGLRRSFMPKAHGYWSLGAMSFAIISSLVAPYISALTALVGGALIALVGFQYGSHYLLATEHEDLPSEDPTQLQRHERIPTSTLQLLVVLAIGQWLALLPEIAVGDWSSVLLHETFAIDIGPNGYAFSAFMALQLATRMLSPKFIDHFGLIPVVRTLGLVGAGGFLIFLYAAHSASVTWALIFSCLAYAFMGLGVATMPPAFYSSIGRISGLPSARAFMITGAIVAVLSMFGRITLASLTSLVALPTALALTGISLIIASLMTKVLDHNRVENFATRD